MPPVIAVTFASEDWDYGKSEALYLAALESAGAEPRVLRPGAERDVVTVLREVDGVLFSGGDDMAPEYYGEDPHPNLKLVNGPRDRMEMLFARAVLAQGLPALGICNGLQVLCVASGGALWQDIPTQVEGCIEHGGGAVHDVEVESGSVLHGLAGDSVAVNSYHHQAVRETGRRLRVTARSADGVVEAAEAGDGPFLVGVQWHPEREGNGDGAGQALVTAFVDASRK
ncbi:MAG: gamma-glutamyl-gamma-aminobutyrate hydrolase family protein [Planctomycetota bacterium]